MSFQSDSGRRLYRNLPAVYRERDNGDLAAYLDAAGVLLDQIRRTLDQRLADSFPDEPPAGPPAQDWLLPYFARLLDARLLSPHPRGRRTEVAQAVFWRQGKGTVAVVEAIAEAVSELEVTVQEGWRRVAVTPRVDRPLLPAQALGMHPAPDPGLPARMARHPDLPAVTPHLGEAARALAAMPYAPEAHGRCHGEGRTWRQAHPHGTPCFPGGYDDPSRRTVDLRTPDWSRGHYHPRRLILHAPPPDGFFPPGIRAIRWADRHRPEYRNLLEETVEGGIHRLRNVSGRPLLIRGMVHLDEDRDYHLEGLVFSGTLRCNPGRLHLRDVAAARVIASHVGKDIPALSARNCLLRDVAVPRGLLRLEYCTVLRRCVCEWIQASDSLLLGLVKRDRPGFAPPKSGCLRYTRLPDQSFGAVRQVHTTTARPVFFEERYRERACAVLHPASPPAIRHGAEDGGELGCYHDRAYVLAWEAVLDKLKDYLPVGQEAVLVPDRHLACPPPTTPEQG